jgi:Lon protease-like protein
MPLVEVPLIPLPNVVLFPSTELPLHIFEPRYRTMMQDALAGERRIAMALLKPGWEQDYYGNPPVHEVVGVGRIRDERRLADGRYNLVLRGEARARIVEVVREEPYRTVRAEVLEDRLDEARTLEMATERAVLTEIHALLVEQVFHRPRPRDVELGTLCDVLAACASVDAAEKQAILEELDVAARLRRVFELMRRSGRKPRPPGEPSMN